MAKIDCERNAKYFKPASYKGGIILGVVGVLLLFTGAAGGIVIGLLMAGLGAFLIYLQVADRPSDADIDDQFRAIRAELRQRALAKLGLDADEVKLIAPIIVGGWFLGSLGSGYRVKKGKDGTFRSTAVEGVVIFFAEQELHAYKYQVSLVAKDESSEQTDVYFYRDVVSVSTNSASGSVTVVGEAKPLIWKREVFSLTTSGGTAVQCAMSASDDAAGREIQGARHLIREKKLHTP